MINIGRIFLGEYSRICNGQREQERKVISVSLVYLPRSMSLSRLLRNLNQQIQHTVFFVTLLAQDFV